MILKKFGDFRVADDRVVLGLDIGSNSIGWALTFEADGETFRAPIAMGVRVFPEGVDRDQTGGEQSRNENRRIARGMRRQAARRARRKRRLRDALIHIGLLPEDTDVQKELFDRTDPYCLREKALREPLTRFELGRVFLHLNQRRGFLSNKKSEKPDKDDSKTLEEISALERELGDRTLGQFLAEKRADPHDRIRGRHTRRDMYVREFEAVWNCQKAYHPDLLTDALKYGSQGVSKYPAEPLPHAKSESLLEKFGLHGLIFFQRPMYWPASVIGRCELEKGEKRAPRADRRFQRFRILQDVNHLRIIGQRGEIRPLTDDQRKKLIADCQSRRSSNSVRCGSFSDCWMASPSTSRTAIAKNSTETRRTTSFPKKNTSANDGWTCRKISKTRSFAASPTRASMPTPSATKRSANGIAPPNWPKR
jgi:CRISPR-associated endonuclease Csn1